MYAVIRSGGKQYKVTEGERIRLENLAVEPGAEVDFEEILAVHNGESLQLGTPYVATAKVKARVLTHGRGKKIIVARFKRRKGFHKKAGHRQGYTEVVIESITV
jgi:large subunit ribosomal protein L21